MKKLFLCSIFTCVASVSYADPIATFQKVCVANAGNVDVVINEGIKAGFTIKKTPRGIVGINPKTKEQLQMNMLPDLYANPGAKLKHEFQCAIIAPDMKNPQAVSQRFYKSMGVVPKDGVASGSHNGKTYFFLHKSENGEAFVIHSE